MKSQFFSGNRPFFGGIATMTAAIALACQPAFAVPQGPADHGAFRHGANQNPGQGASPTTGTARQPAGLSEYSGRLFCEWAAENNGQPCEMKFKDSNGKVFAIQNPSEATRFFHESKRDVRIEATVADTDTLHIFNIVAR